MVRLRQQYNPLAKERRAANRQNMSRYSHSVAEPPYYDQRQHATVDPRSGRVTPNIGSSGESMSAFDRTALERGTNASQNSSVFQRWNGGGVGNASARPSSAPDPNASLGNAPLNSEAVQGALDRAAGDTHSQYGTGSVRFEKPSTKQPTPEETASATTSTGVQHMTPLQQVAKQHPDVMIEGSPANIAFTTAHNAVTSKGGTVDDPMKLANETLGPLYIAGQAKRGGSTDLAGPQYAERPMPGKAAAQRGPLDAANVNPVIAKAGHPQAAAEPTPQGGVTGFIGNAWNGIENATSNAARGLVDSASRMWSGSTTPSKTPQITPPKPTQPAQIPAWQRIGGMGY